MVNLLITGATGNVGMEVIKSLSRIPHNMTVLARLRDVEKEKQQLTGYNVAPVLFDFTNIATFQPALKNCDAVFLLRPPQISEVRKYFKPLIDTAAQQGVKHVVFLSVQGVEKALSSRPC